MTVLLPPSFKPTHPTAGLPGYPAIDVFGRPGETVTAGFAGRVRRLSGHPCREGGKPGGAYGLSVYVVSENGDDRYLTHLDRLFVKVGDVVAVGDRIATLCDSAVSGKPGTTHCHYGLKKAVGPMPDPPERLYDVDGPKGGRIARARPIGYVAKHAPAWVKRFGHITVRHAAS